MPYGNHLATFEYYLVHESTLLLRDGRRMNRLSAARYNANRKKHQQPGQWLRLNIDAVEAYTNAFDEAHSKRAL
jgi:hypothetical protein